MYKIKYTNDYCISFEQEACRRLVFFEQSVLHQESKKYFLSIPKINFEIFYKKGVNENQYIFSKANVFFKINDESYRVPFYNIEKEGRICLGPIDFIIHKTKEELIEWFLKNFWNRKFFFEHPSAGSWISYKDQKKDIADFSFWQEKTKKDKNWIPQEEDLIKCTRY